MLFNDHAQQTNALACRASRIRNGCGKSSLLRLVAGLEPATQGQITQDGQPITRPDPSRRRHRVNAEDGPRSLVPAG